MISVQNIIDVDKSLMTILFDQDVLTKLNCNVNDCLVVLQSKFKPGSLLLVKSQNGYPIKRNKRKKDIYEINLSYKFAYIPEFDYRECSYFIKNNATIRLALTIEGL